MAKPKQSISKPGVKLWHTQVVPMETVRTETKELLGRKVTYHWVRGLFMHIDQYGHTDLERWIVRIDADLPPEIENQTRFHEELHLAAEVQRVELGENDTERLATVLHALRYKPTE